jgi:hypothetical protein
MSHEWPEGHICFPVDLDLDGITDPADVAAWSELVLNELTATYREMLAGVAASKHAAVPSAGLAPAFVGPKTRGDSAGTGPGADTDLALRYLTSGSRRPGPSGHR